MARNKDSNNSLLSSVIDTITSDDYLAAFITFVILIPYAIIKLIVFVYKIIKGIIILIIEKIYDKGEKENK